MIDLELSNEKYHEHDSLSKSSISALNKSPAHFQVALTAEHNETPAMRIGTMVHTAVLEPDTFGDRYVVSPKFNKRTKAGKALAEEFDKANEGKIRIDMDELFIAMSCVEAVYLHPAAGKLMKHVGVAEASIFWERDGVKMRCRPDWMIQHDDDSVTIVDLKTSADGSPMGFRRSIGKFDYDLQEAIYREGVGTELEVRTFLFMVVEPFAPFAVSVYQLDADGLEYARGMFDSLIDLYNECVFLDEWPAYSDHIEPIQLPKWRQHV